MASGERLQSRHYCRDVKTLHASSQSMIGFSLPVIRELPQLAHSGLYPFTSLRPQTRQTGGTFSSEFRRQQRLVRPAYGAKKQC
jgi:hypothetical protein